MISNRDGQSQEVGSWGGGWGVEKHGTVYRHCVTTSVRLSAGQTAGARVARLPDLTTSRARVAVVRRRRRRLDFAFDARTQPTRRETTSRPSPGPGTGRPNDRPAGERWITRHPDGHPRDVMLLEPRPEVARFGNLLY